MIQMLSTLSFYFLCVFAVLDLTVMPSDLSIPEGQMAAFECYGGESKPRPKVTWYKDSTHIMNGSSDARVFISELSGTLFIRDVRNSDAGMYHCNVSNVAGTLISQSASLTVLSPEEGESVCVCVCILSMYSFYWV